MAQFAADTFTGTDGAELSAYSAVWSKQTGATTNAQISSGARVKTTNAATLCMYQHSGSPVNANYSAKLDLLRWSIGGLTYYIGPTVRASTTAATYYMVRNGLGANNQLYKVIANVYTQLGTDTAAVPTLEVDTNLRLEAIGTAIKVYWANSATAMISQTDGDITAAGKAGFWIYGTGGEGSFTGVHLDNFSADDAVSGGTTFFKSIVGGITLVGVVTKKPKRKLLASLTPSATISARIVILKKLLGSTTPSGLIRKLPKKSLVGSVTATGTVLKKSTRKLLGSLSPIGGVIKKASRKLTGSISPTASYASRYITRKAIAGSLLLSGTVSRIFTAAPAGFGNTRNIIKHLMRMVGK